MDSSAMGTGRTLRSPHCVRGGAGEGGQRQSESGSSRARLSRRSMAERLEPAGGIYDSRLYARSIEGDLFGSRNDRHLGDRALSAGFRRQRRELPKKFIREKRYVYGERR